VTSARIMFPVPLMSTIEEIGAFLSREETAAASGPPVTGDIPTLALGLPDHTRDTPHDDTAPVASSTTPTNGACGWGTGG
jgi:hypothetical protein